MKNADNIKTVEEHNEDHESQPATTDHAAAVIERLRTELAYERETTQRLRKTLDELSSEREAILSIRDYAIGTENELGQMRYELQQRDLLEHELRKEIIETHAHLAETIKDAQAAHQRLAHEPSARVRSVVGKLARKARLR